jgi:cytochrome oxidase assembly protein ShyY1
LRASHPGYAVVEGAPPEQGPSLIRGRWLWATIVVILGTALFIRLGIWQLDRLQQRGCSSD